MVYLAEEAGVGRRAGRAADCRRPADRGPRHNDVAPVATIAISQPQPVTAVGDLQDAVAGASAQRPTAVPATRCSGIQTPGRAIVVRGRAERLSQLRGEAGMVGIRPPELWLVKIALDS